MIADRITARADDGWWELWARLRLERWEPREFQLRWRLPQPGGPNPGHLDATPVLAAVLPMAMRLGEDVAIDGPVSPRLLASVEDIMRVYRSFYPRMLRPVGIRAERGKPREPGKGTYSFFTSGVDSWYTVITNRSEPSEERISKLVYLRDIDWAVDPGHRHRVTAATGEAAVAAGLDLVAVETNVLELSEPLLDWPIYHGAALGAVALALGPRRFLLPSSFTYGEECSWGSHADLDWRWSTETTEVVHHGEATRLEKTRLVADHAPALHHLKVCLDHDADGNCGRCNKCLETMIGLKLACALDRCPRFDAPLDVSRVPWVRIASPGNARRWLELRCALDEGDELDRRIGRAIEIALVRTDYELLAGQVRRVLKDLEGETGWPASHGLADAVHHLELLKPNLASLGHAAAADGRLIGLTRAVDPADGRHRYALGGQPPGQLAGELGSALAGPEDGSVPLRLAADTRVRAPARTVLRFTLAPLGWREFASLRRRVAIVLRRASRVRRWRRGGASRQGSARSAWLYAHDGPGRLPLYSAVHPVTGDMLLTTSEFEAGDMGYIDVARLGFLAAWAPVTGRLGIAPRPIPWASRLGLRARR